MCHSRVVKKFKFWSTCLGMTLHFGASEFRQNSHSFLFVLILKISRMYLKWFKFWTLGGHV